MIKAKCHCGKVSTQATSKIISQFLCHCQTCQKICGGSRLGGLMFEDEGFSVSGETTKYEYQGGEQKIESHFCSNCGTPMYAYPKIAPGKVVLKANSLVDSSVFTPEKSLFKEEACPWDKGLV